MTDGPDREGREPGRRPLLQDRVTLLGALLLIPALLGAFGYRMIYLLFGERGGTHISVGTFGNSLTNFWQPWGLPLVAGLIVFTFVLVRRHRLLPAVWFGVAGAGLAYAYGLIALVVYVLLNPGVFD